jgi:hypothetical protein
MAVTEEVAQGAQRAVVGDERGRRGVGASDHAGVAEICQLRGAARGARVAGSGRGNRTDDEKWARRVVDQCLTCRAQQHAGHPAAASAADDQ